MQRILEKKVLLFFIIIGLIFVIYNNILVNGFVLDDAAVITGNSFVKKGLAGLKEIWGNDMFAGIYGQKTDIAGGRYRPLSLTLFAIIYQIIGEKAWFYHLVSIVLYAICVFLMSLFLKNLGELFSIKMEILSRWVIISTLLFIVHPIHVEVVANIKSADEMLCAIFVFAMFIKGMRASNIKHYWIVGFYYFLSLCSKETAFFAPIFLYYLNKNFRKGYGLLVIILFFVLYNVIRWNAIGNPFLIKPKYEFDDPYLRYTFIEKLPVIMYIAILYLKKLLFPWPLCYDYSYNAVEIVKWLSFKTLFSVSIIIILIYIFWRAQRNHPIITLMGIFYLIFYLPISNLFMNTGVALGERFIFLASAGFIGAVSYLPSLISEKRFEYILYYLVVPLVLICGVLVYTRNKDWHDNLTLFKADVNKVPNSARAHYYYGREIWFAINAKTLDSSYFDTAIYEVKKALEILPTFYHARYDLGLIYKAKRDVENAKRCFEEVLSQEPNHINSTYELGFLLAAAYNKIDSGILLMEKALSWGYKGDDSYLNLGVAYGIKGNYQKALEYFQKGLQKFPDNPNYYLNIAYTYEKMGNMSEKKKYEEMYQRILNKNK